MTTLVARSQPIENLHVAIKTGIAQFHRSQAGLAFASNSHAAALGHLFDGGVREHQSGLSCSSLHGDFGHSPTLSPPGMRSNAI